MEINVTKYVDEYDCAEFSATIAETGQQNIGRITWKNALQHVAVEGLVTPEQQGELRSWLAEFGAWSREEIGDMNDTETNALLLQFIAGDIRQLERYDSPQAFYKAQEEGTCSGYLYENEGTWWFSIA